VFREIQCLKKKKLTIFTFFLRRRETRGPRGAGGHVRRQVSAGALRVPGQTQPGERLGTDRVLSGRARPDGRTVVPQVRRGRQMGRVQDVFGGPRFPTAIALRAGRPVFF